MNGARRSTKRAEMESKTFFRLWCACMVIALIVGSFVIGYGLINHNPFGY